MTKTVIHFVYYDETADLYIKGDTAAMLFGLAQAFARIHITSGLPLETMVEEIGVIANTMVHDMKGE